MTGASPPTTPEEAYALVASEEPGNMDIGLAWLRDYASAHPDAADAWYQLGSGLDRADHEAEAMDAYDRAFALGIDRLDPAVRPHLMRSTLRNLGRLDESRAMLEDGVRRYPEMRALRVFLALTEASAGRERVASTTCWRRPCRTARTIARCRISGARSRGMQSTFGTAFRPPGQTITADPFRSADTADSLARMLTTFRDRPKVTPPRRGGWHRCSLPAGSHHARRSMWPPNRVLPNPRFPSIPAPGLRESR